MDEEEIPSSSDSELSSSSEESTFNWDSICDYLNPNQCSTNTTLFSILALLKAYVPESYLLLNECQTVLGPQHPIVGGPPFEERLSPFMSCICKHPQGVSLKNQKIAKEALGILESFQILKTQVAKRLLNILCNSDVNPRTVQVIKMLLTKRKDLVEGKTKFSPFIEECTFREALSILELASDKFSNYAIYPQTIARYYYIKTHYYCDARIWAIEAITRAPQSSFTADTLGQINKTLLRRIPTIERAHLALKAFKDVERKAEAEMNSRLMFSDEEKDFLPKAFNNRGLFGFIQVANIIYRYGLNVTISVRKVEEIFTFFEWYVTYSRPDRKSFEPNYVWRNVATCFENYTKRTASQSTSFPGLYRSRVLQADIQPPLLGENRNVSEVEKYIMFNILLYNQNPDSNKLPVEEMQRITQPFIRLCDHQSPEFYLLVSMLFWPDTQNNNIGVSLQEQVTNMETAFERVRYAKYLRGRYLVPLFFLGNGTGLTKWIHKSKLDTIVKGTVTADVDDRTRNKKICETWNKGEVWHIPQTQELLQPVNVEPCEEQKEQEEMVWVRIGGERIKARTEGPLDAPVQTAVRCHLGFNIRGPVVFKVGPPKRDNQKSSH